jgi:hypothetical protein
MSTEDCRALLVQKYPQTLAKDWRRESKFRNINGNEIRRFKHLKVGTVFVNEHYREIATDDLEVGYRKPSSFTAPEFYFSITMNEGDDFPAHALVTLALKSFFDANGVIDCIHLESAVKTLFPKGINAYEEMESVFCIDEELTFEELQAKFIEAGFCPSEKLDSLINGEGDQ